MQNRDTQAATGSASAARLAAVRWLRQGGAWLVGLGALLAVLTLADSGLWLDLRYERFGIVVGEIWRLATGHLVHADIRHLLLNLAGLVVVALLFPGEYSPREWAFVGLASAAAVTAGLWWLNPEVDWYVGLSGVLHGLLAAGTLAWWRSQPPGLALALTAILAGKLAWEQAQGALVWSGDLPVIVDAHLWGAAGGFAAALVLRRMEPARDPPPS